MQNDAATLHCPNDLCQAPNRQTDKFCHLCGTPLVKRYLWAMRELDVHSKDQWEGIIAHEIGELVANRYLLKSNRIVLDTKPGLPPATPSSETLNAIKPYLRLVTYQLQVPQVYGLLPLGKERTIGQILLLEQAPIYTDAVPLEGQLMPKLTSAWKDATSMRQLNWLWQMAQLWQALSAEGVASSLLNPQLLRVEGSLMRLLQLQPDRGLALTLPQLSQLWSQLVAGARPSIATFLEHLCQGLRQGEVRTAEQLIAVLDRGLAEVGRSLVPSTLKIATCTDKGPSRQRNEDACYPPSGTTITKPPEAAEALVIVCDGIGGHEGGDVASNLAIETIQQQVQQIPLDARLDAKTLSIELENSAHAANEQISQRNDNEHRHGRQRMGTTLVMALAYAHEIYIAHVGDSRAYWITRTGCHQVTLDDDVASREVRLGYTLYRDALQQTSSGSLVQALGMTSASLHPAVQRFILNEDCVFLLCSDGLSDYDRVEQSWKTEILPILDGEVDVATAGARLVEIANTQNGHDNVTVGIVYCQVNSSEPESTLSVSLVEQISVPPDSAYPGHEVTTEVDTNELQINSAAPSKLRTQLLPSQRAQKRFFVPLLLGLVLLVSLTGGLLAYLSKQGKLPRLATVGSTPTDMQSPESFASPPLKTPILNSPSLPFFKKGSLLQTKSEIKLSRIALRQDEAIASQPQQRFTPIPKMLPAGSVLQVLDKQQSPEQGYWLNLKVCSVPGTASSSATKPELDKNDTELKNGNVQPSPNASNSKLGTINSPLLQPGDQGWIPEAHIELLSQHISSVELVELGNCQQKEQGPGDTPKINPEA